LEKLNLKPVQTDQLLRAKSKVGVQNKNKPLLIINKQK